MDKIREFLKGKETDTKETPEVKTGKYFAVTSEEEDCVNIKVVDEKVMEELLETNDPRKRLDIIEAIKELSAIMGVPMPDDVAEGIIEKATMPTVQMLLYGMVIQNDNVVSLAQAMLTLDMGTDLREKMDENPDFYKEKGDEIRDRHFKK